MALLSPAMSPARDHADPRAGDAGLAARLRAGDRTALEELYRRHAAACYGLARRIVADEQLAQDVVQDVFLSVWRDPGRYAPERGGFASWLLTMTHHKAVDLVRHEESLRRRRDAAEAIAVTESPADEVEGAVLRGASAVRVRDALARLPDAQREALALAYYGGYTQREIAELTGTPLGTVKTRMLAGMRAMRALLGHDDPDGDRQGRGEEVRR
jgi:RNA polymerase sigma factor (sigma-70 family)